jgi:hypothetical protein
VTAPAPRCACPTCVARSLAAKILEILAMDLPWGSGSCMVEAGTDPYVRLANLEQELIEARGWANAYRAQERARLALGQACPCLSGSRR